MSTGSPTRQKLAVLGISAALSLGAAWLFWVNRKPAATVNEQTVLQYTLSAEPSVKMGEAVTIDFTLENKGEDTLFVLCWYTPLEAGDELAPYGRWAFLADGATPGNGKVENWFELLDSWFDDPDFGPGGYNRYRW